MGSFDNTCALTGLPIKYEDKIRASLLVPCDSHDEKGKYKFWTLPVRSTYNDYGDLEWNDIHKDDKDVLEFVLKITLPALEDREDFSQNVFEDGKNVPLENVLTSALRNQIVLDTHRKRRSEIKQWEENGSLENAKPKPWWQYKSYLFGFNKPTLFMPWMCHDWAWNAVVEMSKPKLNENGKDYLDDEIDIFCTPTKMVYDEFEHLKVDGKFNDEVMTEVMKKTHKEQAWVAGDQGAFDFDLYQLIKYIDDKNPEWFKEFKTLIPKFKTMLKESCILYQNLFLIRRDLAPVFQNGTCRVDYEYLIAWHKLIEHRLQQAIEDRGY